MQSRHATLLIETVDAETAGRLSRAKSRSRRATSPVSHALTRFGFATVGMGGDEAAAGGAYSRCRYGLDPLLQKIPRVNAEEAHVTVDLYFSYDSLFV